MTITTVGYDLNPRTLLGVTVMRFISMGRVTKTPSAMLTGNFLQIWKAFATSSLWLKNFWILCNTKYPDNMQSDELESFRTI